MLVREAMHAAEEWVRCEGTKLTGLVGAYVAGSVAALPGEMPLPVSSDVDITLVLKEPAARKLGKFRYHGVLLEVTYEAPNRFQTPESVLGDPHLAGGIRGMQIVLDPSGQLRRLRSEVGGRYACRRWVRKRCSAAAALAESRLQPPEESAPLHERVTAWLFGTSLTALILLLAGLRPPTVRRRYVEVRELLQRCGRPGFHEELLQHLGCSTWSRNRAEKHLQAVAHAFDRAKCLPKGDFPFAADISEAARPVAIGGSRELIEQGFHREAIFWLVATYSRCQWIFAFNGCGDSGDGLSQGYTSMLGDLGINSLADLESRCSQVLAFLPRVLEVADEVMATTPETK